MENWRSGERECIEGAEAHWFGTCTEQMLLRRMCSAGVGNSKIYESPFLNCSKFWFASICLLTLQIYCVRNLFRSAVQLQIVEMKRYFKFDSIFVYHILPLILSSQLRASSFLIPWWIHVRIFPTLKTKRWSWYFWR